MDLSKLVEKMSGSSATIRTLENGAPVRRRFSELQADVSLLKARYARLGLGRGHRVGILARNSYDWIVADLALAALGVVSVAFTEDFKNADFADLLVRYDLALLVVDADRLPAGAGHGIISISASDVPEDLPLRQAGREESGAYTLVFSSGSAGGLKGVAINRSGAEESIASIMAAFGIVPGDRFVVFLPLSNFQQRLMIYGAIWFGIDLIVVEQAQLFAAIALFKPTIIVAPPMLYELVETRFSNLAPRAQFIARLLGKLVGLLPNQHLRRLAAARIFRSAYDLVGHEVKYLITGMAPIKASTIELFKLMQLPLFEVYGLLEFGMVSANTPSANKAGSVGKPLAGVKVNIRDDGELVLMRGQSLAHGYFECAEGESERTFVGDGAVATGDIGYLDADGFLFLRGRKKELIVTRGGKKIHPEAVEAKIGACPDVARSVIVAEPGKEELLAIIVPKARGASLRPAIEKFVAGLNDAGLTPNVGRIVFSDEDFSRENGFLRPNLKLDRAAIARHFAGNP